VDKRIHGGARKGEGKGKGGGNGAGGAGRVGWLWTGLRREGVRRAWHYRHGVLVSLVTDGDSGKDHRAVPNRRCRASEEAQLAVGEEEGRAVAAAAAAVAAAVRHR